MKSDVSVLQLLLGLIGISAIWGASRAFMKAFRMPPLRIRRTANLSSQIEDPSNEDPSPESHNHGYVRLSTEGDEDELFSNYVENIQQEDDSDAERDDNDEVL
jgi:hypothetical protein